jgi:hypothetical protein
MKDDAQTKAEQALARIAALGGDFVWERELFWVGTLSRPCGILSLLLGNRTIRIQFCNSHRLSAQWMLQQVRNPVATCDRE